MHEFLNDIQGWFAYLYRPPVLIQMLLMVAMLCAVAPLEHRLRVGKHRLSKLPRTALLLALEGLVIVVLLSFSQRAGLIVLLWQITLCWALVRLAELQLIRRWLGASRRKTLMIRIIRPLFALGVALVCLEALGSIQDLNTASLGVWLGSTITFGKLFQSLLVLYLILVGGGLPAALIGQLARQWLGISTGSQKAVELILRYLFLALGVIWVLNYLKLNPTAVLAVAGGLSVGVGFASRDVFSNLISGLWLLLEGNVRPGELLMNKDELCEVRQLGPMATTLKRMSDNSILTVPNQKFFVTETTSYTNQNRSRRCRITVAIEQSADPRQMMQMLEQVVKQEPEVLADPAPTLTLDEFGAQQYKYCVEFTISNPLRADTVSSNLRLAIYQRMSAEGIAVPS